MSAAPFDLTAIRARALADPGKPAGSCRWCDKPFVGGRQSCASADGFRWCHRPSAEQIVCADRFALVAEVQRQAGEVDYLRRREADIIEACERVADGGQYRADIVSAIQRIRTERDEARAELDRLHAAIAAFTERMRGTVHGQRNGDTDEVLG